MSTTLHRIDANFIWRIEAASPQLTGRALPGMFRHLNGAQPGLGSGASRKFEVKRLRRDKPDGSTNQYARIGDHHWQIDVYYSPPDLRPLNVAEIIDQDSHSLIKALRPPSSWVGYDDSNTTTSIGLMARWVDTDEVIDLGGFRILRLHSRVKVRETET
jgi:hypothetical protein